MRGRLDLRATTVANLNKRHRLRFTEGMTHNAFPVTNDSIRRSLFFNYSPALDRDNLPSQRMSIYPDHVLSRLADQNDLLTVAGYV